jgi:LmbE family N-acetylglucosaminyl deacetylase
MSDAPLHPDHQRILELARAALQARDNRQLWRQNVLKAAEEHTHWCNELWEELERQCCDQNNGLNVLEHPSVKQRKMIANLRSEIVNAAMNGIEAALDELAKGPLMEDEDDD